MITLYKCEICGNVWDHEEIKRCESRGIFDVTMYQKGLMFEYWHHNKLTGIFALANPELWKGWPSGKHLGGSNYWACRCNTEAGDSLGEELCGHDFFPDTLADWIKWHHITKEYVWCPEYERMVQFLKSQGIQPMYYQPDGTLITV